jgi:ABC-type polysaccharide/polyol phosphate export permease
MSVIGAMFRYDWRVRAADVRRLLGAGYTGIVVLCLAALAGNWLAGAGAGTAAQWVAHAATGYVVVAVHVALWSSYRERIRRHQEAGVLEACVMTRTPLWRTIFAAPTWDVSMELAWGTVWLAVAVAYVGFEPAAVFPALLTCVLGLWATWMVGMASASVSMALRASDPIASFLMAWMLFCSGVVVPRESLPEFMQWLGAYMPAAPMVDALREALGTQPNAGWEHVLHALALAAAFTLVTFVTVRLAVERVLGDGAFSQPD